jgi:4-hydroxybenzoate polyprenyltransferase
VSRLKQVLGLVGLLAALAGIALENPVLVWTAICLLGASAVIRAVLAIQVRRRERKAGLEG